MTSRSSELPLAPAELADHNWRTRQRLIYASLGAMGVQVSYPHWSAYWRLGEYELAYADWSARSSEQSTDQAAASEQTAAAAPPELLSEQGDM